MRRYSPTPSASLAGAPGGHCEATVGPGRGAQGAEAAGARHTAIQSLTLMDLLTYIGNIDSKRAQAISPTAPQPPRTLAEPRRTSWNPGGTLVEPWWNPGGTLVERSWNLTSGPPRTTPEPIWAETPKLSAVEENTFPCGMLHWHALVLTARGQAEEQGARLAQLEREVDRFRVEEGGEGGGGWDAGLAEAWSELVGFGSGHVLGLGSLRSGAEGEKGEGIDSSEKETTEKRVRRGVR